MTARPRWDADLDAAAVRRLPPAERRLRTVTSLRRKVEWAEAAAQAVGPGDPEPSLPKDKAALRRLHDPALGLWAWSDRVVDAEGGPNADLMSRWRGALDSARSRRRRGIGGLREEIAIRDRRVTDLERQVAGLLDERRSLREAMARHLGGGGK